MDPIRLVVDAEVRVLHPRPRNVDRPARPFMRHLSTLRPKSKKTRLVTYLLNAHIATAANGNPAGTRNVAKVLKKFKLRRHHFMIYLSDLHIHYGFGYSLRDGEVKLIPPTNLPATGINRIEE